jgi:AAA+ superfamily predicted ATPase
LAQAEQEISLAVRARCPVIYLVTWEEARASTVLRRIAEGMGKSIYFWSCSQGFEGDTVSVSDADNPLVALSYVAESPERAIFVFRDLHPYLRDFHVVRRLRDIVSELRRSFKTVVILSPELRVPLELEKDVTVTDFPLPDVEELKDLLKGFLGSVGSQAGVRVDLSEELIERVAQSTTGMTVTEAESAFAKVLVRDRRFTEEDLPAIIAEKKQIVRKSGILEYYDLSETMADVGGLDGLKDWLRVRQLAFSEKAREYGLPLPKGLLLIGVQGCGKSLTAKAAGGLWKLPILRLDVGRIFSMHVGESEANVRAAIATASTLSPCILWVDEIEKSFSGTGSSNMLDAGVTQRVFGTFITWLQEKKEPVFVIATANRVDQLPPELLRRGRFDEIFFVDLPRTEEREDIYRIHILKRGRDPAKFDVSELGRRSRGFSGAEIEQTVIAALYRAFPESREVTTDDILAAIDETVPLATLAREHVDTLRRWADVRARPASSGEPESLA